MELVADVRAKLPAAQGCGPEVVVVLGGHRLSDHRSHGFRSPLEHVSEQEIAKSVEVVRSRRREGGLPAGECECRRLVLVMVLYQPFHLSPESDIVPELKPAGID